jgi:hypothetical protein
MKYWTVDGWNDPAVVAVVYTAAKHESAALQAFVEAEGDEFKHVEATEISKREFNELTA